MQQELPRLFSERGELIDDVDTSSFDAATLARFEAVRTAHQSNKQAQDQLTAAYAEVESALAAVKSAEAFFAAHWPKQTFQDLWRENFGGGPRNRMHGVGRI